MLADDLAIATDGTGYSAELNNNIVARVSPARMIEVIAGSPESSDLIGATAPAFGRSSQYRDILYVTTGGGEATPFNKTYVEGGRSLLSSSRVSTRVGDNFVDSQTRERTRNWNVFPGRLISLLMLYFPMS